MPGDITRSAPQRVPRNLKGRQPNTACLTAFIRTMLIPRRGWTSFVRSSQTLQRVPLRGEGIYRLSNKSNCGRPMLAQGNTVQSLLKLDSFRSLRQNDDRIKEAKCPWRLYQAGFSVDPMKCASITSLADRRVISGSRAMGLPSGIFSVQRLSQH